MFLKKKLKQLKPLCFFLKKPISDRFFYTGNYHLGFFSINKKKVNSVFNSPIGQFKEKQTNFLFFKKTEGFFNYFNLVNKTVFIAFSKPNFYFYSIFDLKNSKFLYSSSYGCCVFFKFFNLKKKTMCFLLPSGKFKFTHIFVLGFLGRRPGFFFKNSFLLKYRDGRMNPKVNGVSMNPVDHHNGGRTKNKPLYLNKYNNIAKNNKRTLNFLIKNNNKRAVFKFFLFFFKFFKKKNKNINYSSLSSLKPLFFLKFKIKKEIINRSRIFIKIKKVSSEVFFKKIFFFKKIKVVLRVAAFHSEKFLNKKNRFMLFFTLNKFSEKTYKWLIFNVKKNFIRLSFFYIFSKSNFFIFF